MLLINTKSYNESDSGTTYNETDIFISDSNVNLAVKDTNNKLTGKFRLNTADFQNKILRIYNAGYLAKEVDITLAAGQLLTAGTVSSPLEIYPGDVGRIGNGIELVPDNKIDNVDFSAWLKIYKDNMARTASMDNITRADFTRNGTIDNIDFSLWLASYKKVISQ